jgi:hypothetical protein
LKLEFFVDGLEGQPMILLYGGGPEEVVLLRNAMRPLSGGVGVNLAVDDLPFVQPIDKCRLRVISAGVVFGVTATSAGNFEWTLDPKSWLEVDKQLDPLCTGSSGVSFQHLNPGSGPEIIYSTDRTW